MTNRRANADQEHFWDADAGPVWVRNAAVMDICLAPVLDLVLTHAALQSGECVLDIGCGAGASTFAAARLVAPGGHVTGVDISQTLLAHAKSASLAPNADFVFADAETHNFTPDCTDALISRFGVMFFENPTAAFHNMARSLRSGGRIVFAAWGQIPANPYFLLPAIVSKTYLGARPKTDPDAPGPFAFRDPDRVCGILKDAGLRDVQVDVVQINLTPAGGAAGFAELAMQIGPAPGALAYFNANAAQHRELQARVTAAAEAYVQDAQMRLPAEINLFSARKP
jgi:SAM-dependent methyltransferase